MLVTLALRRLKQNNLEFKATLGNMARHWWGRKRKRKEGGRDGENGGKKKRKREGGRQGTGKGEVWKEESMTGWSAI